ncbi:MAG: hypothetical protein HPY44_21735 [Armatimonadetes bacterium]|nr:hypothetical protein [Armatimonadota bacterium]
MSAASVSLPYLSEYDPVESAEGSIDPLGLYPIADSLATLLAPGVRERQQHPRFLTAMAVSHEICSVYDEEQLAADGVTEPWLVFEWYMVEGLVRTLKGEALVGVPGRDKAQAAIRDGVPLSRTRYLKSPANFGFHAVYRRLALELEVELAGGLGETGHQLLTAWAEEQDLRGFFGTSAGPGRKWRERIQAAINDGLAKGATDRSGSWEGWGFFGKHLAHTVVPPREAHVIRDALCRRGSGHRATLVDFIVSPQGRQLLTGGISERRVHEALLPSADGDLRSLLETIGAYERFARLLTDAFNDCLHEMTPQVKPISPARLGQAKSVHLASERVPDCCTELQERLETFRLAGDFVTRFGDFSHELSPGDWVGLLMDHHDRTQRNKPPNGKAPWCERFDDGSFMVRPQYRRDEPSDGDEEYVHQYRTRPLWSFVRDLGMVS